MDRLHEVYSALGAEELLVTNYDVGSVCCGQFLDDDGWYRAEILDKQDEGTLYIARSFSTADLIVHYVKQRYCTYPKRSQN